MPRPSSALPPAARSLCRSNEAAKRQKILDTAATLLELHGYHDTSMDGISRLSGMSKKTLYLFFPSKQALFETLLVERLLMPMEIVLHKDDPLEKQLLDIMLHLSESFFDEKRLSLIRSIIADTTRNPSVRDMINRLFRLSGPKYDVKGWLIEQEKSGTLVLGDPEDAVDYLFGLTLSIPLLSRLTHFATPRKGKDLVRFIQQGIQIFLAGHRAPP